VMFLHQHRQISPPLHVAHMIIQMQGMHDCKELPIKT